MPNKPRKGVHRPGGVAAIAHAAKTSAEARERKAKEPPARSPRTKPTLARIGGSDAG